MAQLAIAVAAASFVGSAIKGHKQRKMKLEEARAYRQAAARRMSAMTREVAAEERNKHEMYSRALAVAASSGAGVDDPGVVALLGDLNAEGDYRILSTIYTGQNEAQGYNYRAEAARREGDAAWEAGLINGVTSAVSSYYSMGGFNSSKAPAPKSLITQQKGGMEIPGFEPGAINA